MKYVELKVTQYKLFEMDDDFDLSLENIRKSYYEGKFIMDHVDEEFVDVRCSNTREEIYYADFDYE